MDFCKMDIGPTLGRKNLLHDFSFPNCSQVIEHKLDRFFKEIVKTDFLEEYRPNVHFAEVHVEMKTYRWR